MKIRYLNKDKNNFIYFHNAKTKMWTEEEDNTKKLNFNCRKDHNKIPV